MLGYAEVLKLREDYFCCHHRDRRCQKGEGLRCWWRSFTALGRAQKQILLCVWHYSMWQCRTLSPESLVSPANKGMGHILGYFLLLEIMEISSPCAKALPFSWQRAIVMTVQLASTFNLTVDLCAGASRLHFSRVWILRIECFLNSLLVSLYIFVPGFYIIICLVNTFLNADHHGGNVNITTSRIKLKLRDCSRWVNQILQS